MSNDGGLNEFVSVPKPACANASLNTTDITCKRITSTKTLKRHKKAPDCDSVPVTPDNVSKSCPWDEVVPYVPRTASANASLNPADVTGKGITSTKTLKRPKEAPDCDSDPVTQDTVSKDGGLNELVSAPRTVIANASLNTPDATGKGITSTKTFKRPKEAPDCDSDPVTQDTVSKDGGLNELMSVPITVIANASLNAPDATGKGITSTKTFKRPKEAPDCDSDPVTQDAVSKDGGLNELVSAPRTVIANASLNTPDATGKGITSTKTFKRPKEAPDCDSVPVTQDTVSKDSRLNELVSVPRTEKAIASFNTLPEEATVMSLDWTGCSLCSLQTEADPFQIPAYDQSPTTRSTQSQTKMLDNNTAVNNQEEALHQHVGTMATEIETQNNKTDCEEKDAIKTALEATEALREDFNIFQKQSVARKNRARAEKESLQRQIWKLEQEVKSVQNKALTETQLQHQFRELQKEVETVKSKAQCDKRNLLTRISVLRNDIDKSEKARNEALKEIQVLKEELKVVEEKNTALQVLLDKKRGGEQEDHQGQEDEVGDNTHQDRNDSGTTEPTKTSTNEPVKTTTTVLASTSPSSSPRQSRDLSAITQPFWFG